MKEKVFLCKGKKIKRVSFLGYGKSTKGILSYLKQEYGNIEFILRCKDASGVDAESFSDIHCGENEFSEITEDILFLSPSVRRDRKELIDATGRGVILSSDAELFFENKKEHVFAITGSDGKSTTTYLTSRLLNRHFENAIPCGNYGEALSPHISDMQSAFVTELSSFQLMYLQPYSESALITNITENHLNWHSSFDEYISAKANILKNTNKAVINFDCQISKELCKNMDPYVVFSGSKTLNEIKTEISAAFYITRIKNHICVNNESFLCIDDIKAKGNHNVLNFMGALGLCIDYCHKDDLTALAKSFSGLAHRCEKVGVFSGVTYYNSSIDSSPKRTVSTLEMMTDKVILILGGRSKGLDYDELSQSLVGKTKKIIITGENREEINSAFLCNAQFCKSRVPVFVIPDFYEALDKACNEAVFGDTVLFSPASTSYDSFKSFEERGEAFKDFIRKNFE